MNPPERNKYLACSREAAIQASKQDPGQKICVIFDGMTPKWHGHVREEAALEALATGYYPFSPHHAVGNEFTIVETYLNGQLVTEPEPEPEDEFAHLGKEFPSHPLTILEDATRALFVVGNSYQITVTEDGFEVTGTFLFRTKK